MTEAWRRTITNAWELPGWYTDYVAEFVVEQINKHLDEAAQFIWSVPYRPTPEIDHDLNFAEGIIRALKIEEKKG